MFFLLSCYIGLVCLSILKSGGCAIFCFIFLKETRRADGSGTVGKGSNSMSSELASAINEGLYFYEQVGGDSVSFPLYLSLLINAE